MNELSDKAGKRITLDKIPQSLIDEWAECGFNAVWLMGVWTTGKTGIQIARDHEGLRETYTKVLPDFRDEDVIGSPYAIAAYTISRTLGGPTALQVLRKRLAAKGMGLVLDFVPNHTARDYKWLFDHPEYYINGKDGDENSNAELFFKSKTKKDERVIAFGRDPYFPGWTDTAQLNPLHQGARKAMIDTLHTIAKQCDGIRCDMAMLLLNTVFQKTWGEQSKPEDGEPLQEEFWCDAIQSVHQQNPSFVFLAEAYWNLEWPLQQLGFTYTYDKTLYDRMLREGASSVRDHLKAETIYQMRSARFLENHDEPRVAQILPNESWQYAAAVITATVPGMLLLHEGQMEGRKVKIPVQLGRRPHEDISPQTKSFYKKLLRCLQHDVIKNGTWELLPLRAGWHDNHTYQNIISFCWRKESSFRLIVVNYAPLNSQAYVELDAECLAGLSGTSFELRDLMSPAVFVRDRHGLQTKGMYFDLAGYGLHIFEVKTATRS
ncbi:MAG: alpha-amylase family glycosyl hydrolase [bacterium]